MNLRNLSKCLLESHESANTVRLLQLSTLSFMLSKFRRYVWERRRGLLKLAGVAGGIYFVANYLLERLEEIREALRQEQLAKEKRV
jgi:Peroxin-3